jgi:response regulator of citrate/malate metabolism
MSRIPTRLVVHARDIENITGFKRSWVNKTMKKIRTLHNKTSEELITLDEFCSFMKMKEDYVRKCLGLNIP